MIIDYPAQEENHFETDLCIIGAGIMTHTLLIALRDSPMRILVVERGGMTSGPDQDHEKSCEIQGHPFTGHLEGRYFGVGGTSEYWGGQALPLADEDFVKRDWISFSGWPLTSADILPFIPEAESIMGVDPVDYNADVFNLRKLKPLNWGQMPVRMHFSKWSPRPNFKPLIVKTCTSQPGLDMLIHAVVGSLKYDKEEKQVKEIEILATGGRKGTIQAKQFILAAGGIENARLLLLSETMPRHPYTGRMFQDHPTAQAGTILSRDPGTLQRYFSYFFLGRTRCLPRISTNESWQTQTRNLAATAFIQFIPPEGTITSSLRELYRSFSRGKMPSVTTVKKALWSLRLFPDLIRMVWAFTIHRYLYVPDGRPRLTIMAEQEPSWDSYIGLSAERDDFNMPKAEIHWNIPDTTLHTIKEFCTRLEHVFHQAEIGTIQWDEWMSEGIDKIREHIGDAYHHMGTTRMSQTPESGVVNADCRVHDVDNLWVAGTSVFPTTGHSNPTLTAMALALRLGYQLSGKY